MTPTRDLLTRGELSVVGRLTTASNATLVCDAELDGTRIRCVYKPIRGERPLWDFPDGSLAGREVASFRVSEALGWSVVPLTVLRDGPFGTGMVQQWIDGREPDDDRLDLVDLCPVDAVADGMLPVLRAYDADGEPVALVHADDGRLQRMAVFDAIINNADRKGGHIIETPDGHVYGVDHGICLHTDDKLRTVLWGWAGKPVPPELLADMRGLSARLGRPDDALVRGLGELISAAEVAALGERARDLVAHGRMPMPGLGHPIPWPPF
ncbi:SCO1664 family protein [Speluncibacter jeojiensis]|uniref:SCO1664 family protein n=1 Tax=Speluncibacter jeojiensis TaxID=2710754 RepID=A0A9X4RF84_9ACTN|nr:SCO1664 family protein [Corynebacteriales bacterium D3-21]